MDPSDRDVEDSILEKLARHRNWRHRYIARRDAIKYAPQHLAKEADRAIDRLLREGLLGSYKKGACIYLVPSRRFEILMRAEEYRKKIDA